MAKGTFRKTTKLMSEEEAGVKWRKIWRLLGSGEGYVQKNEEGGKYFLTMEIVSEKKDQVEAILRG